MIPSNLRSFFLLNSAWPLYSTIYFFLEYCHVWACARNSNVYVLDKLKKQV